MSVEAKKIPRKIISEDVKAIQKVLRKFKDWSMYSFSIDFNSSESFVIKLYLSKVLHYPEKTELKVKPLFAEITFEKYYDNLTIYYNIHHYENDKQYTVEEKEVTVKSDLSASLYLLKLIRKQLNKSIKELEYTLKT